LEALDSSNRVIYSGDTTASIIGGEITELQINLYPVVFLLKLDPMYQEVGESCTVDVKLYNVGSLFGISFRVEFDPSILLCTDAESGDFLGPLESTIFFSKVDTLRGYVAVGYSGIQGSGSGVSGSGTLARIWFKPVPGATGEDSLTFNEETLTFYDQDGENQGLRNTVYIHNAQVLVSAR